MIDILIYITMYSLPLIWKNLVYFLLQVNLTLENLVICGHLALFCSQCCMVTSLFMIIDLRNCSER